MLGAAVELADAMELSVFRTEPVYKLVDIVTLVEATVVWVCNLFAAAVVLELEAGLIGLAIELF